MGIFPNSERFRKEERMNKREVMKGGWRFLLAFSVLALSFGIVVSPTVLAGGAFDGKTFVGEMGKQGQEKGDRDTFIFKEGKFRSAACDPYGFGDAPYQVTAQGDATRFEAETVSPTDGRMQWKGMVKGDAVDGVATWLKPGKAPASYWFKGALRK